MAITDDSIRERHGLACREPDESASNITIFEGEQYVFVDGNPRTRKLTQWQARYLAAKLYRLARRLLLRSEVS